MIFISVSAVTPESARVSELEALYVKLVAARGTGSMERP